MVRAARSALWSSWILLALLLAWEVRARQSSSLFVPPVSEIMTRFQDLWLGGPVERLFVSPEFLEYALPSLSRMARGWLIAVAVSTPLGILLGRSRQASWFLLPVVRFGMATPSVMLLPLAIAVFGITDSMNIFVVALGCTWPVLVNTIDGVRGVDRVALLSARSMRLSRRDTFLRVLLPGASPQIIAGLRVSLGVALILMVSSELYAVTEGLGRFILASQQSFRFVDVWAGVFLIAILGLAINLGFTLLERRLLRWHHGARSSR